MKVGKKHLVIFLFILVLPSKVLLFTFPQCPMLIMNASCRVKSPLCEGFSLRCVILILSTRG